MGLAALIDWFKLDDMEDQISFDTPVKYKCRYKMVVTKNYGLPQVRQRRYMFVYRPDQLEDEGLCNQDIGDLWEELMEILEEPVVFSLTSFFTEAK